MRIGSWLSTVAALSVLTSGVTADAGSLFDPAARMSDADLAAARGGVRLPNGMDVSLGIHMDSYVDGQLTLRTVLTPPADAGDQGSMRVFAGTPGENVGQSGGVSTAPAAQDPPEIRVDRGGVGTQLLPGTTTQMPRVTVSSGTADQTPLDPGLVEVPVQANGLPVDAGAGAVRLVEGEGGTAVVLESPTLELRHLIGTATGQLIANTGNDRRIDTITEINVDITSPMPLTGSEQFRVDAAILGAVGATVR